MSWEGAEGRSPSASPAGEKSLAEQDRLSPQGRITREVISLHPSCRLHFALWGGQEVEMNCLAVERICNVSGMLMDSFCSGTGLLLDYHWIESVTSNCELNFYIKEKSSSRPVIIGLEGCFDG